MNELTFRPFGDFDLDDSFWSRPASTYVQMHHRTCNLQSLYGFAVGHDGYVCVVHPKDAVIYSATAASYVTKQP